MRRLNHRNTFCLALAILATTALPTLAQRYNVIDLGILPGKISTSVYGNHSLNNAGHVVGHCNIGDLVTGLFGDYFSENVAYLWTPQNGIQALPLLPGAANATGYTLNDRGQILGMAGNSWLDQQVVLWENGTVRGLGTLPGDNSSFSQAINNHGQVVGQSGLHLTPDGSILVSVRPFLWENGQMTLLPMGEMGGQANDINEKGQICGQLLTGDPGDLFHAMPVLWDKRGSVTVLGSLGGNWGFAWDINQKTQIVGHGEAPDGSVHAFLWENGVMTDLGTLGGGWASLWAMNDRGQAVGESTDAEENIHAILIDNGMMISLNTLIPVDSGWDLAFADGINNRGQISGTGLKLNSNGEYEVRGFLLTPRK